MKKRRIKDTGNRPKRGEKSHFKNNFQHLSMIVTLQKMGIEGFYLNIIKAIYNKPTANIILNGENQSISSKIRNKTRVSSLTTSFNIVLEVQAAAIREQKEIKQI